jgi:hypothetical protein
VFPAPARWSRVRVTAQVAGQLDLHRPLHQPLGQLAQQATGPDDLLLRPGSRQQLVDELVRQLPTQVIGHPVKHPRRRRHPPKRLSPLPRVRPRLIAELAALAAAATVTKRRSPAGTPQTSPLFEEAGLSAANDG